MSPEVLRLVDKVVRQSRKRALSSSTYIPPAKGYAYARLVGYFEMGKHEEEYDGKKRTRDKVDLVFELSGPNHQARKLEDGTLIPHRVTVQETLPTESWSNCHSLFVIMNDAHDGLAAHMVEFLGKAFIVEVFHRRSNDRTKVYANLKGPAGYNIRPIGDAKVDVALTDLRAFIWSVANKAMWDEIYIPGFYEERKDEQGNVVSPKRSKNVLQERIASAKNWNEHPLSKLVRLP